MFLTIQCSLLQFLAFKSIAVLKSSIFAKKCTSSVQKKSWQTLDLNFSNLGRSSKSQNLHVDSPILEVFLCQMADNLLKACLRYKRLNTTL